MSNSLDLLIEAKVKDLVRQEVQSLHSYHVPDATGFLKLDAMENPFQWPGELQAQWLDVFSNAEVNRYPDPTAASLKQSIRELLKLDALASESGLELDILLGNGSDEIIQILAMALANTNRGVLSVEPAFVMYKMIAQFVGVPYHGVELNPDFTIDPAALLSAIQEHNPSLVFLAVPNNPTGNVFDLDDVKAVIEASDGLVVLDEAYMAFTDSDLLSLAAEYPNVVVMRTFSKVGLAGLRLGFLVGSKVWLEQFEKLRLPYNINVLTQISANFALKHYTLLQQQCDMLKEARTSLIGELEKVPHLEVFPSQANFVLVRCTKAQAKEVFEAMKEQGVLIKCLHGAHPLLDQCLRLTVGTEEQNKTMVATLQSSLGA